MFHFHHVRLTLRVQLHALVLHTVKKKTPSIKLHGRTYNVIIIRTKRQYMYVIQSEALKLIVVFGFCKENIIKN